MRHRQLRFGLPAVAISAALVLGACGGSSGGGGNTASVAPPQQRVTVTPETAANPFALQKGTYRLNWKTTDCAGITMQFAGDTGFQKEKTSTLPTSSWILTSVPDGVYTVTQADAACTAWEIIVERIGGGAG